MSDTTSSRVPKYAKHKATGQARVQIDGRTIYLGKYGSAASNEAYRRLLAELEHGNGTVRPQPTTICLSQVMVEYLKFARGYYRKYGKVTRECEQIAECCKFIKTLYGRTPAAEFGPLRLKAVRDCMIKADHSREFINKNIDRIRRMFKWAASEEMIPPSVPDALATVAGLRRGRSLAKELPPVMPVEDAIVDATLEHMPTIIADMVRLQRITGMRPMEVCIVRPCDIVRTGDVWVYRPESHKTEHLGRERAIPCGPRAQEILLRYLARDPEAYCFRPCDSEEKRQADRASNRKTPLSCGNRPGTNRVSDPKRQAGSHYSTGSYRRAIHRAAKKAFPTPVGLEGKALAKWCDVHRWAPNRLRHTSATEIRRLYGLEAAQTVLGHKDPQVTQRYAERDLGTAILVAAKIG